MMNGHAAGKAFTESTEDRRLESHLGTYHGREALREVQIGRFDNILKSQCYTIPLGVKPVSIVSQPLELSAAYIYEYNLGFT